MTQLSSSSEEIAPQHNPTSSEKNVLSEQSLPGSANATTASAHSPPGSSAAAVQAAAKTRQRRTRGSGSPWCRAALYTVMIVVVAYIWLSWTDPDQVEMRRQAWEAAMEKIRGKQVVYTERYNEQYRFRPAASPVITEALNDGRKKIRGARHGDDIPMPKPSPTSSMAARKQRRKKNKQKRP